MEQMREELEELKKGIELAKTNLAKLEGAEAELLRQLNKDFEASSKEEAEEKLEELTEEMEGHQKDIDKLYKKLKEEYQW